MSGLSSSALDDHLQRYATRGDVGDENGSDASETDAGDRSRRAGSSEAPSFLSLVFADSSPGRGVATANALTAWWQHQHPIMVRFLHQYGTLLINFISPFTPRGARRAGYLGSSHAFLRSLDRLDAKLPGGEGGWASRWSDRSRARKRECPSSGARISVEGAVGSVGVAAAAVVFAAVSWCSWRRSSPSWPALLVEVACGSAWAANYVAREDGKREAKLFEARLVALERSLGQFFRGVQACTRMVRCSQALSFGLRLSVPMPPVARMETRLPATGRGAELALREVRSALMEVLQGGVKQTNAFESKERCAGESPAVDLYDEDQASGPGNDQALHLLAGIAGAEKQLVADLRRFVEEIAARIDTAMADSELWGVWWNSELEDVSEAVMDLATYFEAAATRLEMVIGPGGVALHDPDEPSSNSGIAAAAEALSSLRLRYEETVVRLYSCQSSVGTMLRDPASSTADAWEVVRRGLADARIATGPPDGDGELWNTAERLMKALAEEGGKRGADLIQITSPSTEVPTDTSRHLEAGVGWISLTTPRREGPRVFEGGNGDEGTDETVQEPPADAGVTDVLVGMPSPGRGRRDGEQGEGAGTEYHELGNERSRVQLVGELDSVLRARPLPATCEKHLPLESQKSLEDYEDSREDSQDSDGESGEEGVHDLSPCAGVPASTPEPQMVTAPVCENTGSPDLMSELRAQISMAVNEEIFASDRDQPAVLYEDEEDSILVEHEGEEDHSDMAASRTG